MSQSELSHLHHLEQLVDYHRCVLFVVSGVFMAIGAGLLWGIGAASLAFGTAIGMFRICLELSRDYVIVQAVENIPVEL